MKKFLNELMVHDTYIYGYGINSRKHELYFDVDIVQEGVENNGKCMFKVRPATIVFKNVWDITIDVSTDDDIIISHIETTKCGIPKNKDYVNYENEYKVNIECLQGNIMFKTADGYLVFKGKEEIRDGISNGITLNRLLSFSLDGEIVEFLISDHHRDRGSE